VLGKIQNPLHLLKNKGGVMDFIAILTRFGSLTSRMVIIKESFELKFFRF
jgi:hypothetical protein